MRGVSLNVIVYGEGQVRGEGGRRWKRTRLSRRDYFGRFHSLVMTSKRVSLRGGEVVKVGGPGRGYP